MSIRPQLRANVREMAAALIASGIDPAKSILFAQSAVPAHAELAWILQCTARMGWLNRMTQFKEKSGKNREGSSVGLFTYPVLQAADILLYRATHVPVGEDQKQHVELTRDIALKFNTDFDVDLFVPPEPFIGGGTAARVMSLRDGRAKMSQVRSVRHEPDQPHRQRRRDRAEDPQGQDRSRAVPADPAGLDERPEAKNLVGIYGAVTGESVEQVLAAFAGQGFGAFKPALADALIACSTRCARGSTSSARPGELDRILADGVGTGGGAWLRRRLAAAYRGGRPVALADSLHRRFTPTML